MKKQDPDGERIDLTHKVEVSEPPKPKWQPPEEKADTMVYGGRTQAYEPPLEELALMRAREGFRHLPADDPLIKEKAKEILAQWVDKA